MTKEEFRAKLDELGLKPEALRKLAGVSIRAVYRYLDGSRRVPPSVASYLRLYEQLDETKRAAELVRANVQPEAFPR